MKRVGGRLSAMTQSTNRHSDGLDARRRRLSAPLGRALDRLDHLVRIADPGELKS